MAEIGKASARATDLVRRLLTFGRQQEPKRECTRLRPVIEEAVKLLRTVLPTLVEIRAKFTDDLPDVAVDATQVHQVITNLATNAAHAIGTRTGTIDLRVEAVVVSPEVARTSPDLRVGRYVRLSMSDDGSGMDAATLERIFDPFFTTKPVGQGTGLGLSVVHGIMKRHGGAITARSALGKGSTFCLYFPVATVDLPADVTAPKAPISRDHRERLLYVDDDEALVFLQTRMLGRMSYEVTAHTNPVQALAAFRSAPDAFDAVITDWAMPGMSGVEHARRAEQGAR